MAIVNEGVVRLSQVDFDGQKRQFSFPTTVVTAANHDAQKTLHDALVAAIDGVTLGNTDFEEYVADRESVRPIILPASASAQVNIQWVVTYVDGVTGAIANVRIPCADITDTTLFAASSNLWDPTDADWIAFVTAFEAYVLSEAGNAVTVSQVAYLQ
ncbi:hypothetical protein LCGC14_1607720 [marine sediment metagenome]|uniref:Uncharacterized protein n=1 Tax=marine sediment metagenome TaxID=412755 RepID=A0A0F9L9C1_9ZZZZ